MIPGEISKPDVVDIMVEGAKENGGIKLGQENRKPRTPGKICLMLGDKHAMTLHSTGLVDVLGKQVINDPLIYTAFSGWLPVDDSDVTLTTDRVFPDPNFGPIQLSIGPEIRLEFIDDGKKVIAKVKGELEKNPSRIFDAFRQWLSDASARQDFTPKPKENAAGAL